MSTHYCQALLHIDLAETEKNKVDVRAQCYQCLLAQIEMITWVYVICCESVQSAITYTQVIAFA